MKKTNSQKLIEYVNTLPDVCTPFFLETANAMATSTKCAYAKRTYTLLRTSYICKS